MFEKGLLIFYFMVGDLSVEKIFEFLLVVEEFVGLIEFGIFFSDLMVDGKMI